jgi:hypothetical protein
MIQIANIKPIVLSYLSRAIPALKVLNAPSAIMIRG